MYDPTRRSTDEAGLFIRLAQWLLRPGVWGKWCQKLHSGNVQRPNLTSWKYCFMKVHFQNLPPKKTVKKISTELKAPVNSSIARVKNVDNHWLWHLPEWYTEKISPATVIHWKISPARVIHWNISPARAITETLVSTVHETYLYIEMITNIQYSVLQVY